MFDLSFEDGPHDGEGVGVDAQRPGGGQVLPDRFELPCARHLLRSSAGWRWLPNRGIPGDGGGFSRGPARSGGGASAGLFIVKDLSVKVPDAAEYAGKGE